MLRRSLRLAGVALAVFALAACEISIGPAPFTPDLEGTYTARIQTSPTVLSSNVSIAQGETLIFRINIPDGVRDLLYAEVGGSDLRVGWLSTTGATLAVSESRAYFAGSVDALGTANAVDAQTAVAPHSIDVPFLCLGPCAAISPKASGYYYLAVRNLSGGSNSFDLFAYTMFANDTEDRGANGNDTIGTATQFGAGDDLLGAIELLGDRDWFRYTGSGDRLLTFTVADGSESAGLVLRFEADGFILRSGDPAVVVRPDDLFEVYSELGRAGPAGSARYIVENDPL